jgi:hypothetical protein
MGNLKQRSMTTGAAISVLDQFYALGVLKLIRSVTDEAAWIAAMRKHWTAPEPTFKILENCPSMISEFEDAMYYNMSEKQLQAQNYREEIISRNNHAMDDCKYFFNSQPTYSPTTRRWVMPNLVKHFVK